MRAETGFVRGGADRYGYLESKQAGRIRDKRERSGDKSDCGLEVDDEIREGREARDGWWYKKE